MDLDKIINSIKQKYEHHTKRKQFKRIIYPLCLIGWGLTIYFAYYWDGQPNYPGTYNILLAPNYEETYNRLFTGTFGDVNTDDISLFSILMVTTFAVLNVIFKFIFISTIGLWSGIIIGVLIYFVLNLFKNKGAEIK